LSQTVCNDGHLFVEKCRLSEDSSVCSIECRHWWTLPQIEAEKWFCISFSLLLYYNCPSRVTGL